MNQEFLNTALECADHIADVFTKGFHQINKVEWKSAGDPVTEFDKQIEQMSRQFLLSRYPDHVILGEEDGLSLNKSSDYKWIIDPIDGTINYVRGIPFVAFSLALSFQGKIIVAVVSNPILDEKFWAMRNGGAFLNGQKITVSSCSDMKRCYMSLGTYNIKYSDIYHHFIHHFQSVRNPGSAALSLAYLAAGRMDALLYFRLSSWDMAAGYLLVEEAGGLITNINSDDFVLDKVSVIAGNTTAYNFMKTALKTLDEFF